MKKFTWIAITLQIYLTDLYRYEYYLPFIVNSRLMSLHACKHDACNMVIIYYRLTSSLGLGQGYIMMTLILGLVPYYERDAPTVQRAGSYAS